MLIAYISQHPVVKKLMGKCNITEVTTGIKGKMRNLDYVMNFYRHIIKLDK